MHTHSWGLLDANTKKDGAPISLAPHILGYFLEQSLSIECLFKLAISITRSPSL